MQWLKNNSTLYQTSAVTISTSWLQDTIQELAKEKDLVINSGDNGNISDDSHNETGESDDEECDNFSEIDHKETVQVQDTLLDIIPNVNPLNVAPGQGETPLHILYDKNSEELCFPTIYCGETIESIFSTNATFLQRSQWELMNVDRRVVEKPELIFFKYKRYQLDYIHDQSDFAVRCVPQSETYTAKDVRNDVDRVKIATIDNGFYFFKKLRNSPQYLQQKKRDLFATIRQLGVPTFFVSLSAADTKWISLLQCLGKIVDGKSYTTSEIENMSYVQKTRLINSDPVTCARYFDRRFQHFLRHILYKAPHPLGVISQHFYRIEFQHRGSPHVHMVLFSDNAPKYKKGELNTGVYEYIDKYISCSLTPDPINEPHVMFQVHKHSKTCRKGGKPTCRFNYPIPPFNETVILEPNVHTSEEQKETFLKIKEYLDSDEIDENSTLDDLLIHFHISHVEYIDIIRSSLKHDKVYLKRKPYECRVNMYMKNLLYLWEANMDCQFCLDPYSVIAYIVNYINKENRGLSLNLQAMTRQCEKEKRDIRQTIKKLGNVFLNTSEVCVQECVYILLEMPLAHQSIDVVSVNTAIPSRRTKVLKSKKDLKEESNESTNIFRQSVFDIYIQRPEYFENWTLADYITIVRISKRSEASTKIQKPGIYSTRIKTQYYLSETHRYSIGKKRILSFMCPSKKQNLEEHYRIHFLLFYPWRVEPELGEVYISFEQFYNSLSLDEKTNMDNVSQTYSKEDLASLHDIFTDMVNDASNLVLAPLTDQINAEDLELGITSLTGGSFFQPMLNKTKGDDAYRNESICMNQKQTKRNIDRLWNHEEICVSVPKLNTDQRMIYDHIMKHVATCNDRMYYMITGSAGTGKSVLLRTLYQSLSRFYSLHPLHNPDLKSVLKLSATGKAAYLIKGQTIHAGLGIRPADSYEYYEKVAADRLNSLYVQFQNTKVIMIDEVSLVGTNFFRFIDCRLQEICGNSEPFGGMHMICFGDLYQLPPVKDKWIFENNKRGLSSLAQNLWVNLFEIYELHEIMRQKDEKHFAELLNRMRTDSLTERDLTTLQKRVLPVDEFNDGLTCLHLFATNKAVRAYNRVCYDRCPNQKEVVQSVDTVVELISMTQKKLVKKKLDDEEALSGTFQELKLGIGITYEVNYNINVEDGLANGTSGILKYIQYVPTYHKPMAVWLEFEEE